MAHRFGTRALVSSHPLVSLLVERDACRCYHLHNPWLVESRLLDLWWSKLCNTHASGELTVPTVAQETSEQVIHSIWKSNLSKWDGLSNQSFANFRMPQLLFMIHPTGSRITTNYCTETYPKVIVWFLQETSLGQNFEASKLLRDNR